MIIRLNKINWIILNFILKLNKSISTKKYINIIFYLNYEMQINFGKHILTNLICSN